ncbi:hypothetical protein PHYSODRAFT_529122, partial [Phytophthora sojae]
TNPTRTTTLAKTKRSPTPTHRPTRYRQHTTHCPTPCAGRPQPTNLALGARGCVCSFLAFRRS